MNTKQNQFSRQRVTALLFTGLILVVAAFLTWTGTEARGSTVQPAQVVQECAYAQQPEQMGLSVTKADCFKADLEKGGNGLPAELYRRSAKGGKGGIFGDCAAGCSNN